MRRSSSLLTYVLVVLTALAAPLAYASERPAGITSQAELDRAVAQSLDRDAAARDSIRTLLHRDEVRSLAAAHGLDLRKAEASVATLDGDELQSVSAQAAQVDAHLAGGDPTISISLVSLLLIIIIIILLTR
jgi:hypothetical protein